MQPGYPLVNKLGPMALRPQGYPWFAFDQNPDFQTEFQNRQVFPKTFPKIPQKPLERPFSSLLFALAIQDASGSKWGWPQSVVAC